MVPDVAAAAVASRASHHSTRSSNAIKPGQLARIFRKMAVVEADDHRIKIPMKAVADDDKVDPNLHKDTIAPTISAAVMSNLPGRTTAAAAATTNTPPLPAIRAPTRIAATTSNRRAAAAAAATTGIR